MSIVEGAASRELGAGSDVFGFFVRRDGDVR